MRAPGPGVQVERIKMPKIPTPGIPTGDEIAQRYLHGSQRNSSFVMKPRKHQTLRDMLNKKGSKEKVDH